MLSNFWIYFLHVCCTPQFRAGATSLNKLITIVFVLAHRLVELQQVYFVLLPDTQSLGVIEHFCNVSLGVHVSQHAAGVHFPIHIPTTTSHRHHHHNVCAIRSNKNGGASTKQFRVSSRIGSASHSSRTHWSFLLRFSFVLQPRFYKAVSCISSACHRSRTHWSFLLRFSFVLQPRFYKEVQQKRKGAEDATRRKRHRRRICMFNSWQQNGGASTKQFLNFEPYWFGLSQLAHSLVLFVSVFLCFATQV